MSTVRSATEHQATSWFSQPLIPSLKSRIVFERVYIQNVPDIKQTGVEPKKYWRVRDLSTGDLYQDESWAVLAIKCVLVVIFGPFHCLLISAFHLGRTAALISLVSAQAVKELCAKCKQKEVGESGPLLWNWCVETVDVTRRGVWEIPRGIFYTFQIEWAAAYGVVDPFEGRKLVAAHESNWHRGVPYEKAWCCDTTDEKAEHEGSAKTWIDQLKNWDFCHLAPCFRIRGNTNNTNIAVLKTSDADRKLRII